MKRSLFLLGAAVLMLSVILPTYAQVVELPEIEIKATNYKYISAMGNEADLSVQQLEDSVADYNLQGAEFYQDEYQTYYVTFFIPEGKILAAYDGEGKLLRTIERFKDVKVPKAVKRSIGKKYPGWTIAKDVYRVTYHDESGEANKRYKLVLENAGKRVRVKVDESGEFI
jgi:hypothetical protein